MTVRNVERKNIPNPRPSESDAVAYVQGPDPGHVLGERGDAEVVPEGEVDVDREDRGTAEIPRAA